MLPAPLDTSQAFVLSGPGSKSRDIWRDILPFGTPICTLGGVLCISGFHRLQGDIPDPTRTLSTPSPPPLPHPCQMPDSTSENCPRRHRCSLPVITWHHQPATPRHCVAHHLLHYRSCAASTQTALNSLCSTFFATLRQPPETPLAFSPPDWDITERTQPNEILVAATLRYGREALGRSPGT